MSTYRMRKGTVPFVDVINNVIYNFLKYLCNLMTIMPVCERRLGVHIWVL